jgi:hypothetical protein
MPFIIGHVSIPMQARNIDLASSFGLGLLTVGTWSYLLFTPSFTVLFYWSLLVAGSNYLFYEICFPI